MDSRPAVIELAKQDMRRTLRLLPKHVIQAPSTDSAWVVTAVTAQMWDLFYPSLSFIETDTDPIFLWSLWKKVEVKLTETRTTTEWRMECWCVGRLQDNKLLRSSSMATAPFGEALTPSEELTDEILLQITGDEMPMAGA